MHCKLRRNTVIAAHFTRKQQEYRGYDVTVSKTKRL